MLQNASADVPTGLETQPSSSEREAGPYPPPSEETVQAHTDLQAQIPIRKKLEEIADAYPEFRPNLTDKVVMEHSVDILLAFERDGKLLDPNYSIASKTPKELANRLGKKLSILELNDQDQSDHRDNQLIDKVRDDLRAKYPNRGIEFGKAMVATFSNDVMLQAAIEPYLANMEITLDKGEPYKFSNELAERVSAIQNNIEALDLMSNAAPEYAEKIEAANIDVTDRAAVQSFVQTSGFLEDESVDETTKAQVLAKLDMPRPTPTIVTGTQANKAMDAVDENGKSLYTEDHPLAIREGVDAYVKPDGSRVARVEVDGIGIREIPWERGEDGNVIGLKLSLIKIWAVNEAKGNTDFFGETLHIDTQIVSQTDPEKLRKVQQVMEALLGGDAGYDGEIITDAQADFIGWFNQYMATKGDAAEGDFDKNTAAKNRAELGLHPHGDTSQLDYEVLRAAGSFAQGQYGSGAPDYAALQQHLHDMFPEKNIPLTGENTPDDDN